MLPLRPLGLAVLLASIGAQTPIPRAPTDNTPRLQNNMWTIERALRVPPRFNIRSEDGRDVYVVNQKAISVGYQLSFQDRDGHELASIKQKVMAWGPTYEIFRDTVMAAVVKKKLAIGPCRFTVDVPGPDDLEASANLTDREYTFTRSGRVVAKLSKEWVSMTAKSHVDITPGEDEVLILATATLLDKACHPDDGDRK
jgi:uncharacterized protein YxjI